MEDVQFFDQKTYSEYMDDLNYSQGFYITPPKDGSVMLGEIRRVGDSSDDRYLKAELAAKFAVEEHNNTYIGKEWFLEFVRIVNLNLEPSAGSIYYITAAVVDADGEACRYQLKIWEKLNTGYKVEIFRPAPYSLKFPEKLAYSNSCVAIHNLMPWMDENYLYYKCFLANPEIVGIEVDNGTAYVWLRNSAQKEVILNKYRGRKMPHSDLVYAFDTISC